PEGSGLLYTAGWRGAEPIFRALIEDQDKQTSRQADKEINSPPAPVFPANNRVISEFDISPDGSVAFVAGAPDNPCDLFLRRPDGQEIQLTQINHKLLAGRTVAPTDELIYSAPDGREVQAWLLYPPDFDPTKQYPLAVHIHGGPH